MTGTPHVVNDVMTHTVLALRRGAAFHSHHREVGFRHGRITGTGWSVHR
ncbi:hypothetical protein ACFWPQ_48080 [Streptomyces sp. NPDC058464]